jgi:transposase
VHARREFLKAERTEPLHAAKALAFYRQLYDIEDRGKFLSAAERLELRQRLAVGVWKRFREWLDGEELKQVLPKSALGKALTYLRNQWDSLQLYLADGRLPIDNNQSEREIRPLVLGRRNWTFLGHPYAAPGQLKLFSIASSAHRHDLIVADYCEDVLRRLADAQQNEPQLLEPGSEYLRALLPDQWAAAHPQSVRESRREEREDVAETKGIRRLERRLREREERRAAAAAV